MKEETTQPLPSRVVCMHSLQQGHGPRLQSHHKHSMHSSQSKPQGQEAHLEQDLSDDFGYTDRITGFLAEVESFDQHGPFPSFLPRPRQNDGGKTGH